MDAELDAALAVDEVDDIAAQTTPGGQEGFIVTSITDARNSHTHTHVHTNAHTPADGDEAVSGCLSPDLVVLGAGGGDGTEQQREVTVTEPQKIVHGRDITKKPATSKHKTHNVHRYICPW